MGRFEKRDEIRRTFGATVLTGQGIEVGAGAFPHSLPIGAGARYYDLRTDEEAEKLFRSEVVSARPMTEIRDDFPDGADFLIAHNVLEHCPDPIGTLIRWNRHVRVGGVVLISLPHHRYCPDDGRRLPSLQHLIDDFLAQVEGTDFISREHTASFTLGWAQDYCAALDIVTVERFARRLLLGLHEGKQDVHWHALDTSLSLATVAAAAAFDGAKIASVRCWAPDSGETVGDILISYTIAGRDAPSAQIQELVRSNEARERAMTQIAGWLTDQAETSRNDNCVVGLLTRPFVQEGSLGFLVKLPVDFIARIKSDMILSMREGELPLGPADSLHDTIRQEGAGRFSFWKGSVYFSSSDGSDCNVNGRNYLVIGSRQQGT